MSEGLKHRFSFDFGVFHGEAEGLGIVALVVVVGLLVYFLGPLLLTALGGRDRALTGDRRGGAAEIIGSQRQNRLPPGADEE